MGPKIVIAIIVTFLSTSAATADESCNDNCTADELVQFSQFKRNFSKSYDNDDDECESRTIFCKNYRIVFEHNSNPNSTFKMALSANADRPVGSIRATGHISLSSKELQGKNSSSDQIVASAKKVQKTSFFSKGLLSGNSGDVNNGPLSGPVKDQGFCGSCWAFCAAAVLQYQALVYRNQSIVVSEQELMECNDYTNVFGCSGGNAIVPMEYAKQKGVGQMIRYPYRMIMGNCRRTEAKELRYKSPFTAVSATAKGSEAKLRSVIDQVGVVAIGIGVANSFNLYDSGVYSDAACPTKVSHCVTLVGYGSDATLGLYWILKNSWGTDWGEAGYFRMQRGTNMCGIETASYYLPMPA